jgi:serine protease inhibitor
MKKIMITLFALALSGCTPAAAMNVLSKTEGHLNSDKEVYRLDEDWLKNYNDFAFDLHQKLIDDDDSTFFSPASILLALAMTSQGAHQETLNQMLKVFHMEDVDQNEFAQTMKQFQLRLLTYKYNTLSLANSIWMRKGYDEFVRDEFLNINRENYGAFIASLDFNDPQASKTINHWVKDNTGGLIDKIVEDQINPLTVMFLINTIYFNAEWMEKFEKKDTRDDTFYAKTPKQIKFMNQDAAFPYVETDDYQAVMLPYKEYESSMIIFLPKEGKNIELTSDLYQQIFRDMVSQTLSAAKGLTVRLSLPKMELSTEVKLAETLQALGMTDAFDPGLADFSQMSSSAIEDQLHIANVLHKAVLKVDEKGTEAAAATSVEMGVTSMPISDVSMIVNRPFTVILADATGAVIFMGHVLDPLP